MDRLWTRISRWLARAGQQDATPAGWAGAGGCGEADGELPLEPEKPWGCGWFDSSLDLRQGLAVIEHQGVPLDLAVHAMLVGEAGAGLRLPT